jgi:hypothetical protein
MMRHLDLNLPVNLRAMLGLVLTGMALLAGCFDLSSNCGVFLCPSGTDGGTPPGCDPATSAGPIADTCGVFVSSSMGSDASTTGSQTAPYQTLAKALGAANGKPVYVCGETFTVTQTVTLAAKVDLYGALDCAKGWAYDAATKTQLEADTTMVPVPLTLTSGASGSAVYDFAITAADAVTAGASSVAVLANGVAASFTRVDITVGKGADGAPGTTPTTSVGPTSPTDPSIVGNEGTAACTATSQQVGGAPVNNPLCASSGGAGGEGFVGSGGNGQVSPATPQTAVGGQGQPATDMGTWSCVVGAGAIGMNGGTGTLGTGAATTDLGTIDASGAYNGVAGQSGGVGALGQGGGGGGGAKGKTACAGASGGGGGAGGCGGNGGTGGSAGGASIGIVSLAATLTFDTVTITAGVGGDGGDGGMGQGGGTGGNGGDGGNGSAQGLSNACSGGNGGQGGQGGLGGGGRGGHAIGIAYTGTATPSTTGASFTMGTPGQGGNMNGTTDKGANGAQADVQAF